MRQQIRGHEKAYKSVVDGLVKEIEILDHEKDKLDGEADALKKQKEEITLHNAKLAEEKAV